MSFFSKKSPPSPPWSFEKGALLSLLEALDVNAAIVYAPDFTILSVNSTAEKIFSIKKEDLVGKIFSLDIAKNFPSRLFAEVMYISLAPSVIRHSDPGVFPQILELSLENPQRNLRVVTSEIRDGEGRLWGFVKVVSDSTETVALSRAKSDFIAIAAHQLRTPTIAVSWAIDSLISALGNPADKEIAMIAKTATQNLLKIINDLLRAAEIDEGRFGYEFAEFDLIPFLEKILLDAELISREFGVRLYFKKAIEDKVLIKGNSTQLGLCFASLIDNAIKYNVKNGEVWVGARPTPDNKYIEVAIKDTGVGISDEDQKKIFTKFFRAPSVVKAETTGSGLGLYLAKNIIERHGGTISFTSILGRGTTFLIKLPLAL
ncbi:MAG: hypothetical protein FJY91_00300 [Candidatus Harrisonbacteria bacterium]|nr:hypothetical protein [Candidatus Harrisonbacteria bacterium]